MKAIDTKTGKEVKAGDTVTDFRGDKATFVRCVRAPEPGKTGKVAVMRKNGTDDQAWENEYYMSVYGLKVLP